MSKPTIGVSQVPQPVVISPSSSLPVLDLAEAKRFLDLLDPDGEFTFQTFADSKDDRTDSKLIRVFHGNSEEHLEALAKLNNQGAGIFVMVNAGDGTIHAGEKTCRTNKNVIRIRSLFVDLDGAPVEPVQSANPVPSILVESSPGRYHAYWHIKDCAIAEFTPLQKQLIARFSADPSVHDLARVMRVPGFMHRKTEPFLSKILCPKA